MTTTAEAIVDLIRAQNWKNGGVHSLDIDECVALVEQYAATAAACARVEATESAHESNLKAFDAAVAAGPPDYVKVLIEHGIVNGGPSS